MNKSMTLKHLDTINESVKVEVGKEYEIDWDGPTVATVKSVSNGMVTLSRKGYNSPEDEIEIPLNEFQKDAIAIT